jgi:hypothetical protein
VQAVGTRGDAELVGSHNFVPDLLALVYEGRAAENNVVQRMPTVNPVGSLYSPSNQALAYLLQRDLNVSLRPPETRYYAPTYWAWCGAV